MTTKTITKKKTDDLPIEQWNTLKNSLFPGATDASIRMVLDYCRARQLDPMKKPCHIVPMYVRDAATNTGSMRDIIMPGIYEYRTTAQRTKDYMGHSKPEYGDPIDFKGVPAPEWCDFTVYRWHPASGTRIEFPVRVRFDEVCGLDKHGAVNKRWTAAPVQMLTKCAEAAALRSAFPDELGGEHTLEEMEGKAIDVGTATTSIAQVGGDELSETQANYAKEFAALITAALYADEEEPAIALKIKRLNDELSEDKEVGVAAWNMLSSKDRSAFKAYLKMAGAA